MIYEVRTYILRPGTVAGPLLEQGEIVDPD